MSKDIVYSVPLLLAAPKVIHEKSWRSIDVVEHSYPPDSPWNPAVVPGHLATHHSVILRRHFYLGFRFLLICATVPCANDSSLVLSLLLVAGCCVEVTVSCDEDVREVDEEEELADKPSMTNGTCFDVSQWIFLAFLDEMWFLATGPMVTVLKFFAEFSKWRNCQCIFHTNKFNSRTYTVPSSFACNSSLAVITTVGFFGILTVFNSAEFRSFLLTMCMLAPESTTNSLSSGFMVDVAGKIHSSESE